MVKEQERESKTEMTLPQWLTVEEFAGYMRIGRTAAYRLVALGQVPTRRVGRLIRIPRSAVESQ